jgi:hydroxymethylbilane synthase
VPQTEGDPSARVSEKWRVATRGSALARWQAKHVAGLLGGAELVVVETSGDRDQTTSLDLLGGRGIFVKEVQAAVLDGRADFAVHSAKDLPSSPDLLAPGLTIGAFPERGDPRDALVGCRLAALPQGATVASGSMRRRAQLAELRPDLLFADLRGNMQTRLAKGSAFDAIVVAVAALQRLGLDDRIDDGLDPTTFVPQVGQGALAVECRAGDTAALAALAPLDHGPTRRVVETERAWLATLGGGCELPAGAHATLDSAGGLTLRAVLAAPDGSSVLRVEGTGDDPEELGRGLASDLLDLGGRDLLRRAR